MDARNAKQYSSQERLNQLKLTESLYDAGLFASALLITGIHLSTIRKHEKWFQARALTRYARCLSRLQEHKRSTEYYKMAVSLMNSPLPSDIAGVDSQNDATSAPPPPAVPASAPRGVSADDELEKKRRQERDLVKENIIKTTIKLVAKTKKATVESSVKSANIALALSAAGLTNTGPTTIPAVVPRSAAMKKRLISRVDEGLGSGPATKARVLKSGVTVDNSESATKLYDIEIDYAKSCYKSRDYDTAGNIISNIPEESRTPCVYMLIAKICRKKPSISSFSEKECWECIAEKYPLALEAYVKLLQLNVPLAILLNMIPSESPEKQWMKLYLQGTENMVRMKYQAALSEFSLLNERFPDNIDIKLKLALCLKRTGKIIRACFMYSQVRKLDTYVLDDMYHYGVCLRQLSKGAYINMLAGDLLLCNDQHPDAWCVQALNWEMREDKEKALQMVSKALQICPDHCGALQIKGQLYMDSIPLKALQAFREAHKIEKDITTYEGLVNTYITMERRAEAVEMAKEAVRMMPDIAQSHAIYGLAIFHSGEYDNEVAQEALLKALHMEPRCVQAALCLVLIYETQNQYENAIQILDQQIDYQPPDFIHVKKGEIYSATEQWEQALSSYQDALNSNPDNSRAREGIAQVEKVLSGGDEEDEDEAEELDSNELQEGDTMDADLDQEHTLDNIEDEIESIIGEEEVEHDEDYLQYSEQALHSGAPHQSRARGLGQRHPQTPRPAQTPTDQPRRHSRQLQHIPQQQRLATQNSVPGFGMDYPTTPRTTNTNLTNRQGLSFPSIPQREREYDELEDGGDDMEE